jgi:hypothetical protein
MSEDKKAESGLLALGAIFVMICLFFLAAWPFQALWNYDLAQAVDGVHEITYFQAVGLVALIYITGKVFMLGQSQSK